MTTEPNNEQQPNTARIHRPASLVKLKDKLKATDHTKKIIVVGLSAMALLMLIIVIHGPNKRHHDQQAQPKPIEQNNSAFDLKAYQQQVQEEERERAAHAAQEAIANPQGRPQGQGQGTGVVQVGPNEDQSDISYVKQGWKQTQTWDQGINTLPPGQQANNASGGNGNGAVPRNRPAAFDDSYAAQQREASRIRQAQLQQRLEEIRQRQQDMLARREREAAAQ
ncbi:hypothetical protein CFR80_14770 [Komagataeibacter oboediens]|uniref:Uncharacterized protein n=1 Tax=Komagataeibacter oboediens TaxID=65958 RepID=A0A318QR09_9PROT|nr:hypothetical protein [Komagataeibacter oboediens]PYD79752.1 hypothetical protein CFR80_14770 [Komagataeibacter oboediens]